MKLFSMTWWCALAALMTPAIGFTAEPTQSIKLSELLSLARSTNLQLEVSKKDQDVAIAGVTTANAFPNPEIEFVPGQFRNRSGLPGASGSGVGVGIGVAQPIEFLSLRESRQNLAKSRVSLTGALIDTTIPNITDGVRKRSIEMSRAQDELVAISEDLQLTNQILDRVRVRVNVGEAPRFDLLKKISLARNLSCARLA
jgi:outer membrane protein, heavy metal efflux system